MNEIGGLSTTPSSLEEIEINRRVEFAAVAVGYFEDPEQAKKLVRHLNMNVRNEVAGLVDSLPGEGGGYGITAENYSKVYLNLVSESR